MTMPPKRKHKATKTLSATPLKASLAGIRTSSMPKRRNSLQGGKSRLAPSEPLHMTTRRAAKTVSNNTSSGEPSVASSSSRRSSLNDLIHYDDDHSDVEDARPAKRTRLSPDSGSPQVSMDSFADQPAMNGTQTPDLQKSTSRATSNASKSSGKKRRASDDSIQSSKTVSAHPNGVLTRTQSDISEQQPRRKKRKTAETPAEGSEQPPGLTDASTAPNSPEQIAEVESSQNLQHVLPLNGDGPAKPGRRLPGRRRQPHPNIDIEVQLRRQLNLKMGYRSIAKLQKTLLDELSSRSLDLIHNDPDYYKQCPEYATVMASLDQHRDQRLAQVAAERTNKLEQLERVRKAQEYIEKEQYILRFKDLQDDMLLQCYHRLLQLEREMQVEDGAATDDEENVLAPTHTDDPIQGVDDRLIPKFASRSRAYVEAERMLDHEAVRRKFNQQRKTFVAANEDADDSIDDVPGGFARFIGPDRSESIAHYNIASLADAATEVERSPPSPLIPPPLISLPQVIPNDQADALFLLASISADRPHWAPMEERTEQQPQVGPRDQTATPVPKVEPDREQSPIAPLSTASTAITLETMKSNPTEAQQATPLAEINGTLSEKDTELSRNEMPTRASTHSIMNLLNHDRDVPVSKRRESQPPAYEPTSIATPSRQESFVQYPMPSHNGQLRLESLVNSQESPIDRRSVSIADDLAPSRNDPPLSPRSSSSTWSSRNLFTPREHTSEEVLRRRDPLGRVRAMLDQKGRTEGKTPSSDRLDTSRTQHDSGDRSQMPTLPLSGAFSPQMSIQERPDTSGNDSRRPSVGGYSTSPSNPPLSYSQSPRAAPVYPLPGRLGSQDHGTPYWERDRRMSGSQAPHPPAVSLYGGSPAQPFQPDNRRTVPIPSTHQSPYAPLNGPHLPSISDALPAKPPGPPPSNPINFRFAHYDPAPPRSAYPSTAPNYPPASHPPHTQYGSGYGAPPPYQGGYIPPPGSFQAPPPPPPQHNPSPYPPLKIRQYGGQPILPASMAPPPSHSQTVASQSAPPASSPTGQTSDTSRDPAQTDRPPEPQSRGRRPYRSFHPPGTMFRTYRGPKRSSRGGG